MNLSRLFNKKAAAVAAAALVVLGIPAWTSFQHDQRIHAGFRAAVQQDTSSRVLTITTDGVTRRGFLNQGAALDRIYPGRNTFLIEKDPAAACWYTTMRVTDGQKNLPFWQKIFGGAETEWQFASSAFGIFGSRCAPVADEKTVETVRPTIPAAPTLR